MLQFSCSKCKHEYRVPDKYAGKKARCKKCKTVNVIPELQPVAEFSYENYDSGAEFYGVFQELLEWERTAPTVERED